MPSFLKCPLKARTSSSFVVLSLSLSHSLSFLLLLLPPRRVLPLIRFPLVSPFFPPSGSGFFSCQEGRREKEKEKSSLLRLKLFHKFSTFSLANKNSSSLPKFERGARKGIRACTRWTKFRTSNLTSLLLSRAKNI